MTIVEFFEKSPFENMISCLTAKPDKVIFLGDLEQMNETLPRYEQFLIKKEFHTKIEPKPINKHNLQSIVETLTEIIKTEKDCIFDITGGEDLLILGCGIVFAVYRERYPFKLQRFDLESGKIIDCDCDNEISFKGVFSVTVSELISLYGGIVIPENPQPPQNADKREVDLLWNTARKDLAKWANSVKFLKEFEKRTQPTQDKMNISLSTELLKTDIRDYRQKMAAYSRFLQHLSQLGILMDLYIDHEYISYRYKNSTVRRCLNSPGDILEMKVLFEARHLQENGKPFFDSCHIGVNIDWDGIIRHSHDVKNEIDVILMHALTPVFISCKIGEIQEIEPYKLWTVAERFGGKHVKKVLIAGDFERENKNSEISFRNRTKDMGITFITNVADMTEQDWKTTLKNLVQ